MKIKRYFAPDIREAIRMVREEQGPDAVILSNRKVDGGVEIVAARDFDEQALLNPGKPESRAPAAPEPPPERSAADRRRAEDAFREALGQFTPEGGRSREAEPAAARGVQAPAAPKPKEPAGQGRPSWSDAIAFRESAAQPERAANAWPRATAARENPNSAADPAPRRAGRPAATPAPRPAERSRPAEPVPPRPAGASEAGNALRALQQEMRQMRRVLDAHLGESRWQAEGAAARLDLLKRFGELGFSRRLSLELAERAGPAEDFDAAWQHSQEVLARRIPLADDNLLEYGGLAALVGPTGVGKTTTVAKLAARFRLKHGARQVALITTDNYRIGAQEQISTYGRILDVPVRNAASIDELRHHLAGFRDRRLVLIDTAGMGPRDIRLAEQIALFGRSELPIRSYLVLSAASQYRAMREAIEAFGGFAPEACVLTKLDETEQLGTALSALIDHRLPVAFLCDGQQVPEDLHQARPHRLVERCFAGQGEDDEIGVVPGRPSYEEWVSHANF
jgi:flagellar biosynthesis protein FlhF